MKKILKNTYIFAVLMFLAGIFCIMPLGGSSKVEDYAYAAQEVEQTIAENKTWGESLQTGAGNATLSGNDEDGYTIYSAYDLAEFAYNVNRGNLYSGIDIYLEADINLAGSLWTPIGVSYLSSFQGRFHGNGHTISNIIITDDSLLSDQDYAGLFGIVASGENGCVIENLKIGGYFIARTEAMYVGSLAGMADTVIFSNCRDESVKEDGVYSIGISDSYVFRSASFDGMNIDYTSKTDVDKTLTIKTNYGVDGYLASYYFYTATQNLEDSSLTAGFKCFDSAGKELTKGVADSGSGEYSLIRVPLTYESGVFSSVEPYATSNTQFAEWCKTAGISVNIPTIREELISDSSFETMGIVNYTNAISYKTYVRFPGYKAKIEDISFAGGLVEQIDFEHVGQIEIYFDYEYDKNGTPSGRDTEEEKTFNVVYDISFEEIDSSFYVDNKIGVRAGYSYNYFANNDRTYGTIDKPSNQVSIHSLLGFGNVFYYNFPINKETYYFPIGTHGNASLEGNMYVNFLISTEEDGGSFDTLEELKSAVDYNEIFIQCNGVIGPAEDEIDATAEYIRKPVKYYSGDENVLFVGVRNGYKIKTDVYDVSEENLTPSLTGYGVGGVYLNFANMTGTGDEYNKYGVNNDSYDPISATVEYFNYNSVSELHYYKIILNNHIGGDGASGKGDGEINIVIEREWVEVDVTPVWGGLATDILADREFVYSYEITSLVGNSEKKNLQNIAYFVCGEEETKYSFIQEQTSKIYKATLEADSVKLMVRYDEDVEIKFSLHENSIVITEADVSGSGAFLTSITSEQRVLTASHDVSNGDPLLDETLKPRLASKKSKVEIQFYNAHLPEGSNEVVFDRTLSENLVKIDGINEIYIYEDIAVNINGTGNMTNIAANGYINANFNGGTIQTVNNPYYRTSQIVIEELDEDGDVNSSATLSLPQNEDEVPCLLENMNYIKNIYDAETNNHTAYRIKVYLSKVKYNIKVASVTVDGREFTADEKDDLFDSFPTTDDWLYWDEEFSVNWKLSEQGEKFLKEKEFKLTRYSINYTSYNNGTLEKESQAMSYDITEGYTELMDSYLIEVSIAYDWYSITVIIDSAVDGAGNAVSDAVVTGINQTFKFTYDEDSIVQKEYIELDSKVFNPITLSSKYDLIGWRANGEDYGWGLDGENGYNRILKYWEDYAVIFDMFAKARDGETEYHNIKAIVTERKIMLRYYANGADYLYTTDYDNLAEASYSVEAGELTYEQLKAYAVPNNVYLKIGNTLTGWTPNEGTITNGVYEITLENFAKIYNNENSATKTWSAFYNPYDPDDNPGEITLTANWEKIAYYVNIDNGTSCGNVLKIDTEIMVESFHSNIYKGQLICNFPETYNGKVNIGHKVKGLTISGNGKSQELYMLDLGFAARRYIDITDETIKEFLPKENWFAVNNSSTAICFNAITEAAIYKMYIQPSAQGYYTLDVSQSIKDSWGGNTYGTTEWGGQNSIGEVYFNITYGTDYYKDSTDKVLDNIKEALSSGDVILTRYKEETITDPYTNETTTFTVGLQCVGFVYDSYSLGETEGREYYINITPPADDKGFDFANDTFSWADDDYKFDITSSTSVTLLPVWNKVLGTGEVRVEFDTKGSYDAQQGDGFYLANERIILRLKLYDNGSEKQNIYATALGLARKNYKFVVIDADGNEKEISSNVLSLSDFETTNGYVGYYITLEDLAQPSQVKGAEYDYIDGGETTVKLNKNKIIYHDTKKIYSTYTGTSEFVSVANDGTDGGNKTGEYAKNIMYLYVDTGVYVGTLDLVDGKYSLVENFENFEVGGNVFDAGVRPLKATAKSTINQNLRLGWGGWSVSSITLEGYKLSNLFENIDENNVITFNGGVTILPKEFTIDFEDGSTYLTNGEIVVSENGNGEFSSGSSNFKYTYDKIILASATVPEKTVFAGSEDYDVDKTKFKVCNLVVEYEDGSKVSVTTADGTLIEGNFLWNISKESQFEILESLDSYKLSYKVASFTSNAGVLELSATTASMTITSISINGETKAVDTSLSVQNFFIESSLAVVISGNGSGDLKIVINGKVVDEISYTVQTAGATLGVGFKEDWEADSFASVKAAFDTFNSAATLSTFTESFSDEIEDAEKDRYILTTDLARIVVSSNDDRAAQDLFIKVGQTQSFANPVYNGGYDGLTFAGYAVGVDETTFDSATFENGSIKVDNTANTIQAKALGSTNYISAMWNLSENNILQLQNASISLSAATEAQEISLIGDATSVLSYKQTLVKADGISETFAVTSTIAGADIVVSSGTMTLSDANSMFGTSLSGTYTISVLLSYNDSIQAAQNREVTFEFTLAVSAVQLSVEASGNESQYTYSGSDIKDQISIVVSSASEEIARGSLESFSSAAIEVACTDMKNAGNHTATISVNETYSTIYQIVSGSTVSVEIIPYVLGDLGVVMNRTYGEEIGELKADYFVEDTNETITLVFSGREEGTDIGEYSLNGGAIEGGNANYDTSSLAASLKIGSREEVYIRLEEKIEYAYNGKVARSAALSYDSAEGKYFITLTDEDGNVLDKVEAWIGYNDTATFEEGDRATYAAGILLELVSPNKNVGDYQLTATLSQDLIDQGWKNIVKFGAIELEYSVTPKEVEISNITKAFDFDASFDSTSANTSVTIDGLVDGENLVVVGTFASERVGTQSITIAISSDNYIVKGGLNTTGTITAASTEVVVESSNTTFDYGVLTPTADLKTKLAATFKAGARDIASFVSNITVTLLDEDGNALTAAAQSTSGRVVVGTYKAVYSFDCPEFGIESTNSADNKTIEIKVEKLGIIITEDTAIVKEYDGNRNLTCLGQINATGGYYSSTGLITGDIVEVSGGFYEDELIGDDKILMLLTFGGADKGNYNISYTLTGDIVNKTIKFKQVVKDGTGFIEGGSFVEDGQSVEVGNVTQYKYPYDASLTGEAALAEVENNSSTRTGYSVVGWKYFDGAAYVELSKDNILALIDSVFADAANTDKEIEIYPVWEINRYTISFSGIDLADVEVSYYDTATYSKTIASGNKFTSISTTGNHKGLTVVGENTNSIAVTLENITGDNTISAVQTEVEITVNFVANDINNVAQNSSEKCVASAIDTITIPLLSTTEGTYAHSGWTYVNGGNVDFVDLQSAIADLYPTLDCDKDITLTAVWQAEDYIIIFDAAGGTISGSETIELKYAQNLPVAADMPSASKAGQTFSVWAYDDGENKHTVVGGEKFEFISTNKNAAGKFEITFTAQYSNNTYKLKVMFDSTELGLKHNNVAVASEQEFDVQYNGSGLTFVVEVASGYSYQVLTDGEIATGAITENETNFVVANITDNEEITVKRVAKGNKLTINAENIASVNAKVDGADAVVTQSGTQFFVKDVKTGGVVELTLTAQDGYTITGTLLNEGSGDIDNTGIISGLVKWSGFTSDATITVNTLANANKVDIGNSIETFESLTFQVEGEAGKVTITSGAQYKIETGKTLIIEGQVKYGYEGVTLTENGFIIKEETCSEFDDVNKVYKYRVVISGFTTDFALEFSKLAREYTFVLAVNADDSSHAQITAGKEIQKVNFGGKLNLDCLRVQGGYVLLKWTDESGKTFADLSQKEVVIENSMKSLLESGSEIKLFADIDINMTTIEVTTDEGVVKVHQWWLGEQVVSANSKKAFNIFIGQSTTVTLEPEAGYELEEIKFLNKSLEQIEIEITWNKNKENVFTFVATDEIGGIVVKYTEMTHSIYVQAGINISEIVTVPSAAGGKIYLTDSVGNKLADASYQKPTGTPADYDFIGMDYIVSAKTGDILYFVVDVEPGFEMQISTDATWGNSYQENDDGETVLVYSISGFTEDCSVTALAVASTSTINITMATLSVEEDADGNVQYAFVPTNAGQVIINTTEVVVAPVNNQALAQGKIVTDRTFSFSARTRLGYQLYNDSTGGMVCYFIADPDTDSITQFLLQGTALDWERYGFTQQIDISIEHVVKDLNIYVVVIPKVYTINFINKVGESTTLMGQATVTYNELIDLTGLNMSTLKPAPHDEMYVYNGYWSHEDCKGTQYITQSGETLNKWTDTGYYFDGEKYREHENFHNDVFSIYVGWALKKAELYFSFEPVGVNTSYGYTIRTIIVNDDTDKVDENEMVQVWTSQNNPWRGEVYWGSILKIQAPEIFGYSFARAEVSYRGTTASLTGDTIQLGPVQDGQYFVKLVYNPSFEITIKNYESTATNGGVSWLEQDGINLGSAGVFDFAKPITVAALPVEGYKFLYWENATTGQKYYPTSVNGKEYRYQFQNLISVSLKLRAVFEGQRVVVNVDNRILLHYHEILSLKTNGNSIEPTSRNFLSRVGDEIEFVIRKDKGYTFGFVGGNFTYTRDSNGDYVFKYVLATDGLYKEYDGTYGIDISFTIGKERLSLTVEKSLFDEAGSDIVNEVGSAGDVTFVDKDGNAHGVGLGETFVVYYSDPTSILISCGENYCIKKVVIISGARQSDITSWVVNNKLDISVDLLDRYFAKELTIRVEFERMVWSSAKYRSTTLEGNGTSQNPFIIRTAADMGYAAYLINSDAIVDGIYARKAHYKVMSNINFEGKYWQAIGTEENPFDGVMDLNGFIFSNVVHYQDYEKPSATYSGLFWHVTDYAQIISNKTDILVIWLSIAGVVVVLGIVIAVVAIVRKKKDDKYV